MALKPSRDTLIHCDACGEDYSSTYRRCPFCGAKNDPRRVPQDDANGGALVPAPPSGGRNGGEEQDDGYVFDGQDAFEEDQADEGYYAARPKGGKRLAPKQGGGFDMPPINWPRLITFLCSLVIIVAALVIVFTVIYPQLRGNEDPKTDPSSAVSDAPSQDPATVPTPGMVQPVDPAGSGDPSQEPTGTLPPAQPEVTGITLKSNGFTLSANDITLPLGVSAQLEAVITPSDWSGPVTWTSSNPEWVTVSDTGLVTNVNNSGSFHNAYLTVTAGGLSVQCVVRVRAVQAEPGASQSPASDPPSTQPPVSQAPTGGGPTVGRTGTIVGASSGLRVRSGPGTTYDILASLNNGNTVNVVEDAGGGWYKITFAGNGGTITGYIMGEYISSN